MKLFRNILLLLLACVSLHLQSQPRLVINGIIPAFDNETHTYLLSVDEQYQDTPLSVPVSLSDGVVGQQLFIEGVAVTETYTFTKVGEDQKYAIEVVSASGSTTYTLQFTFLPILTIRGGEVGYEYTPAQVDWQEESKLSEAMCANVKWRGGSTNIEGKHKRNYKLSFVDDEGQKQNRSFGDLRSDNSWVLDAGQVDMFRVRNLTMAQLWQDFAHRPYYVNQEPKALSATRGRMVELFLDDQYRGIYSLCEPIDRKQMKLKKFDADGTIHGGLWKATAYGDATFFNVPAEYDNTLPQNNVWEIKYPEVEDLCPTDYSTLRNAIMFVTTSSDEEFRATVADYFDLPVMVDYYLFTNVGNLFDICGKNILWAVYDKQVDKKLTPAMWDLDCCMGQNYKDDPLRPDYVACNTELLYVNNIFHRLMTLDVNHFNEAVLTRYHELRQTVFSVRSLQQRYIDAYEEMRRSGALQREERRWSGDSDIAGLNLNFAEELDYIKQWIAQRMEFLDQSFATMAIEELHPDYSAGGEERVWDLRGTIHHGKDGIRIQNGRKRIIHF